MRRKSKEKQLGKSLAMSTSATTTAKQALFLTMSVNCSDQGISVKKVLPL